MLRKFLVLVLLACLASSAMAQMAGDDALVIILKSEDTASDLTVSQVEWSDWIDRTINLVNDQKGEFFVEVSNDTVGFQLVNWLEVQDGEVIRDLLQHGLDISGRVSPYVTAQGLDEVLNVALNTLRFQNVVRLLGDKGLTRLALRHIPLPQNSEQPYVRIYYEAYPIQSDRLGQIDDLAKATAKSLARLAKMIEQLRLEQGFWAVTLGMEATAVSDGRPIVVPALSLAHLKGQTTVSGTFGFWPNDELDQKFFAVSLAHWPSQHKLGVMTRVFYSSECISTYGEYIQNGYASSVGLIWRDRRWSIHLTGGLEYFDRQYQDRRFEPCFNLGANFGILSF
ncbi:MAG: hypothetical protein WCV71_04660 [Patescibacteria group bacterium]